MIGVQIRPTEGTMEQGPDIVGKPDPKTREARTVLWTEQGCPDVPADMKSPA